MVKNVDYLTSHSVVENVSASVRAIFQILCKHANISYLTPMKALQSVVSPVKKSNVKDENHMKYIESARKLIIKNVRSNVRWSAWFYS